MTKPNNDDISVSSIDSAASNRGGNKAKIGTDKPRREKPNDPQGRSASKKKTLQEKDEEHITEHEGKKVEPKKSPPRSFMHQAKKG